MKKKDIKVEEELLVHSKKNLVKCPKCGEENIKSVHKCIACGHKLSGSKSCPRCAKINEGDAKSCTNCGYKFSSKTKSIILSLAFSSILMLVLFLLLLFGKTNIVSNFTDTFRIISIVIVVLIIISTFTYGRKEVIDYAAKYNGYSQPTHKRRLIVTVLVTLLLVIIGFLIYYFFFMNK